MDNEYNFGKYIRLIRVKREIAVKDLAAKIEISSSYLSKIETDKELFLQFCTALYHASKSLWQGNNTHFKGNPKRLLFFYAN